MKAVALDSVAGVAFAGGLALLASSAAHAAKPAFVGTWAAHRTACSLPQEKPGAPMRVTMKGYDQHETHCKFDKVTKRTFGGWDVTATCSVQGDTQKHAWRLTAVRDRLTFREGKTARTLIRC